MPRRPPRRQPADLPAAFARRRPEADDPADHEGEAEDDERREEERCPNATCRSTTLNAMARVKLRSRRDVLGQIQALSEQVRIALRMLPAGADDPDVIDALWEAEGLGMLCWALGLVELEPFDKHFDPEWLLATPTAHGTLRDKAEIGHMRETARLWQWRARTGMLAAGETSPLELPADWASLDQLVAVTAMRGYERGLLPSPLRGDFPAFGTGYRALTEAQRAEIESIAYERRRALEWLCGSGRTWAQTPTHT
jgi:hypothetical protein